jgi:predicted O-methyltransferase YrrM
MSGSGYLFDNLSKIGPWLKSSPHVRFFMNRALWETGYPWTHLYPTPIEAIFPGIDRMTDPVQIVYPFERLRGTSMELEEVVAASAIVRFHAVKTVVEVGTFDGNTTLNLALNVAPGGRVVTLDLPPEGDPESRNAAGASGYEGGKPAPFTRRQYVGHPAADRIEQVYGDSAKLDWSVLGGPFDLAFLDGDHSSPYVRSDTRQALSVLRPGGLVLWHDYEWRSVAVPIDRAAKKGEHIHWIRGTRLAVGAFPDPRKSIDSFAD